MPSTSLIETIFSNPRSILLYRQYKIIKNTYIFNNITLASHLAIIKAFPKSDIAIIQINIWDFQNNTETKKLINKCFNIEQYIIIIRETDINLDIPQYKIYWKWGHTTFAYYTHGTKY